VKLALFVLAVVLWLVAGFLALRHSMVTEPRRQRLNAQPTDEV
jgi:hypothetical protein